MLQRILRSIIFLVLFALATVSTKAQVVANFSTTLKSSGCGVAVYECTDISYENTTATPITKSNYYYKWDFGNGNGVIRTKGSDPSNPYTVKASYSTPGLYNVVMTIDDSLGNTYSKTIPVIVYQAAVPNFTVDKIVACNPGTFSFTDLTDVSSVLVGDNKRYDWNFGDGTAHGTAE